jgi:hypothetical protein
MTVLEPVVQFLRGFKGKKINLDQVMTGSERPRKPVLRVMDRLVREGYLEEIEDNHLMKGYGVGGPDLRNPTWRIITKPLAAIVPRRPKRHTVLDRIWLLIRARRRVTNPEIKRLANVSLASAEKYTQLLEQHGYLRMCGKDGHRKVFLLIKDPGPSRPMLKEACDD